MAATSGAPMVWGWAWEWAMGLVELSDQPMAAKKVDASERNSGEVMAPQMDSKTVETLVSGMVALRYNTFTSKNCIRV